jgi:CheY-like chemotaxis protein
MEDTAPPLVAVLIVEDDLLVRMVAGVVLEDAGFTVYEATDAAAAIHVLEEHREIRAVVTDVNMPGTMDGLKLAHYIRGRWPPVKIIVTSGLGLASLESLPSGAVFMTKPYHPDDLTNKLKELIAA